MALHMNSNLTLNLQQILSFHQDASKQWQTKVFVLPLITPYERRSVEMTVSSEVCKGMKTALNREKVLV